MNGISTRVNNVSNSFNPIGSTRQYIFKPMLMINIMQMISSKNSKDCYQQSGVSIELLSALFVFNRDFSLSINSSINIFISIVVIDIVFARNSPLGEILLVRLRPVDRILHWSLSFSSLKMLNDRIREMKGLFVLSWTNETLNAIIESFAFFDRCRSQRTPRSTSVTFVSIRR